jgi:hypothetical protein
MAFPSPSISPPTLESFQWEFNGFKFGAGTPAGVTRSEGLDLAIVRSGDVNFPRDHGQFKGLDLLEARDIIFDLFVKTDGTSMQHTMLALAAATSVLPNEELPLWFQLPENPLMCIMCRPRKRPVKIDTDYASANVATPELVFHATDPRIYSAGHETPLPEAKAIATVAITNLGNMEMRPIWIINGPVTNPFLVNASIAGSPTLELVNPAVREEREEEEETKQDAWIKEEEEVKITKKEREEKEAALKTSLEAEEKTDQEAGEVPTIKEKDQVLVDLGTPHLVLYYVGGIASGSIPTNIARWIQPSATWWDLLKGVNNLKYGSLDNPPAWKAGTEYHLGEYVVSKGKAYVCIKAMTAGEDVEPPEPTHWLPMTAAIQWASAWQL